MQDDDLKATFPFLDLWLEGEYVYIWGRVVLKQRVKSRFFAVAGEGERRELLSTLEKAPEKTREG